MKQLELRTYTRKEIAEITGYEITNSNFSRNVKGTLMKWGYVFQYLKELTVWIFPLGKQFTSSVDEMNFPSRSSIIRWF